MVGTMPRLCISVLNDGFHALEMSSLHYPCTKYCNCLHARGDSKFPIFLIAYTLIKYVIRKGKAYQYDIGKLQMNMGKTYTWRKSIKYKNTYNQST